MQATPPPPRASPLPHIRGLKGRASGPGRSLTELLSLPAVSFTDDDKEQLRRFTNRSFLLEKRARQQVWLGLVDVLLAYAYEVRTTEGEPTVSQRAATRSTPIGSRLFDLEKGSSAVIDMSTWVHVSGPDLAMQAHLSSAVPGRLMAHFLH